MISHPFSKRAVRKAARSLGFELSADELAMYRGRVNAQMELLSRFYEEEGQWEPEVPLAAGRRFEATPGMADPYRAWLWRGRVVAASDGPLGGVTVGLKDHIPLAGAPLTYGSAMLAGNIATFDAPAVTRMLEAGAAIVGKNNMDNFSMPGASKAGLGDHPRPINPAAPSHATGGSSSGGAVAVAAGDCDVAIGGDQGGSVRIPAAFCGVVGMKPTQGAVSHYGILGSDPSVDVIGPITRTVELNAQVFEVIAGNDGLDYRQAGAPAAIEVMETIRSGVRGLRIGVLEEGAPEGMHPAIRDAVERAAATLAELGADVRRVSIPEHLRSGAPGLAIGMEGSRLLADGGFTGAFALAPLAVSVGRAVATARAASPQLVPPGYKLRYITAELSRQRWKGGMYAAAMNARVRLRARYDREFERGVDVLLMPTIPHLPRRVTEPADYLEALDATLVRLGGSLTGDAGTTTLNTMPFNMSGHPALAVPVGTGEGLPISVQFVAPYFGEALLYRCALVVEAAERASA